MCSICKTKQNKQTNKQQQQQQNNNNKNLQLKNKITKKQTNKSRTLE